MNWGPAHWIFFHSLAANITEFGFSKIGSDLIAIIRQICFNLPCPECTDHAKIFWKGVNMHLIKNKYNFIHLLFIFHNKVNERKKKLLFDFKNMFRYHSIPVTHAFNVFATKFLTTNEKLMSENLHRRFILKNIHKWLMKNLVFFTIGSAPLQASPPPPQLPPPSSPAESSTNMPALNEKASTATIIKDGTDEKYEYETHEKEEQNKIESISFSSFFIENEEEEQPNKIEKEIQIQIQIQIDKTETIVNEEKEVNLMKNIQNNNDTIFELTKEIETKQDLDNEIETKLDTIIKEEKKETIMDVINEDPPVEIEKEEEIYIELDIESQNEEEIEIQNEEEIEIQNEVEKENEITQEVSNEINNQFQVDKEQNQQIFQEENKIEEVKEQEKINDEQSKVKISRKKKKEKEPSLLPASTITTGIDSNIILNDTIMETPKARRKYTKKTSNAKTSTINEIVI